MNERQNANLVRKGLQETDQRWQEIIAAIEDEDVKTWEQFAQRVGYNVAIEWEPLCYAMAKISGSSDVRRCYSCVLIEGGFCVCHPEWMSFHRTAEKIKYGWYLMPHRNWHKGKPDLLALAKNFSATVKLELARADSNRALVVSQ